MGLLIHDLAMTSSGVAAQCLVDATLSNRPVPEPGLNALMAGAACVVFAGARRCKHSHGEPAPPWEVETSPPKGRIGWGEERPLGLAASASRPKMKSFLPS